MRRHIYNTYSHYDLCRILGICALLIGMRAQAYDLMVANADGINIYYNVTGAGEAEVTYAQKFHATADYAGHVKVPDQITVEGMSYDVTGVSERAFFNCRDLTKVTLPRGIKSIGMMAFAWSDRLTSILLPPAVQEIGANAFEGCYSLTGISVNGANHSYYGAGSALFDHEMTRLLVYPAGKSGPYIVPKGVEHIGDNAFGGCTWLSKVTLLDGVRTIGANAFYFCNGMYDITIPATVDSIGRNALNDCINLEAINVAEGNEHYASVDGVLYDRSRRVLIQSPGGTAGAAVMPKGMEEVGELAFYRNHALTTVQMPEGGTTIGPCAFIDCGRLATVELPSTLTSIGDMAFGMCPGLQAMYMRAIDPKSVELGEEVFINSDLSAATLYVPSESRNLYRLDPQWRQFGSIESIDELKAQTISWDIDRTTVKRGARIPLNARSSSGLEVEYAFSPSTLERVSIDDDGYLTVDVLGPIHITVYQNGDHEYLPAQPLHVDLLTPTGIESVEVDENPIKVYGGIGVITIKEAAPEEPAYVYDLSGMCLYEGTLREIPVASGRIYIVRISGRAYKVAVR